MQSNTKIEGLIYVDWIESVNQHLICSGSRKVLSKEARKAKEDYKNSLIKYCQPIKMGEGFIKLTVVVYLKSHFNVRDLDNTIKMFLDELSKFYEFNDNRVVETHLYKNLLVTDNKKEKITQEAIYFQIVTGEIEMSSLEKKVVDG